MNALTPVTWVRRYLTPALLAYLAISWTAGMLPAAENVELFLADGTHRTGQMDLPAFVVRTDYGFLTVPVGELIAIYPGFAAPAATLQRVAALVGRLADADQKTAAGNELKRIGRPAIPSLQNVAAGSDKDAAAEADRLLKELWPCNKPVDPRGDAIGIAKQFIIRGQMSFRSLRFTTAAGGSVVPHDDIQLLKFGSVDVPDVDDWPDYAEPTEARPDVEVQLADGSRIRGQLDRGSVVIKTAYGVLTVPVKDVISLRPGRDNQPDEVITRRFMVRGTVEVAGFNIRSKVGALELARDQVEVLRVVLPEEVAAAVGPEPPQPKAPTVKPGEWTSIFNGKDMTGWRAWGTGEARPVDGTLLITGEAGTTFEGMQPAENVIVSAEVKLAKPGAVKLLVRDTEKGPYYLDFTGRNGTINRWDAVQKRAIELAKFNFQPTPDEAYEIAFAAMGSTLLVYVNGQPVATVTVQGEDLLGPGKVGVGTFRSDAYFRNIRLKILK